MEEIQQFCSTNYGVTFELFQKKVEILGDSPHPLYGYLMENAEPAGKVQWNFEKISGFQRR